MAQLRTGPSHIGKITVSLAQDAATDASGNGSAPATLTLSVETPDLVEAISEDLKIILQEDLEQTVTQQSRQISRISGQALSRLQSDFDDSQCGALEAAKRTLNADGVISSIDQSDIPQGRSL